MQGIVQSAFLWGYTVTQFAGGTLADKYGGELCRASSHLIRQIRMILSRTQLQAQAFA